MKQETNMEHSAEWYRGAVAALEAQARVGGPVSMLEHYRLLLAAAEAREAGAREAPNYRWRQLEAINSGLLRQLGNITTACKPANLKAPDGKEWTFTPSDDVVRQYWEHLSKHVMEAMASTSSEATQPSAAEVISVAKAALRHAYECGDTAPFRLMRNEALAAIAAWEAGNGKP